VSDTRTAPALRRGDGPLEETVGYRRMLTNVKMHTRWETQYARRHPHLAALRGGMSVWAGLRIARLRWVWSGSQGRGWQWAFYDYWGCVPKTGMSLVEKLRRAGISPTVVASKLLDTDKLGILPCKRR
jgi:hypothetical protein